MGIRLCPVSPSWTSKIQVPAVSLPSFDKLRTSSPAGGTRPDPPGKERGQPFAVNPFFFIGVRLSYFRVAFVRSFSRICCVASISSGVTVRRRFSMSSMTF